MTLVLRLARLPTCHHGYSVLLWQQQQRNNSIKPAQQCAATNPRKLEKRECNRPPPETSDSDASVPQPPLSTVQTAKKTHITKPANWPKDDKLSSEQQSEQNVKTDPEPATTKPKLSREAVRQNVQGYMFTRFFDLVKNYDKVLEKTFPSAVKVYRVFFDGVREFYADMKRYLKVSRIASTSPDGLKALNRRELELYMQMPRDMIKVAPALIFSSLPMVGYLIFPLVFMYPRTFLTSHFWTLQQRLEFQQLQLRERLLHNRPVLRLLQSKLKSIKQHEKHAELDHILGLLGSGFHPSVDALLSVKDVFAEPPYSLMSLSGRHIKLLQQMHGLSGMWFKRHRLREHAFLVHHMDLAIGREGGVHNMPADAIRLSCHIRGLSPINLSNDEMIEWLRNWVKISTSIREEHLSLFVHLPILLGYNHPNNWQLIYGDKM